MDATFKKLPSYIKYFFILSNILLSLLLIVIANPIISPLLAAIIVAILLKPFSEKLEDVGIPRVFSSLLLVILFFLTIVLFITFFTAQITNITADPTLTTEYLEKKIAPIQTKLSEWFGFSLQEQLKFINNFFKNAMTGAIAFFPTVVAGTASYLAMMLLFVVSQFFFLYYRSFFMTFIYKLFDKSNSDQVNQTITKIENSVKRYIVGLFFVILIMATLNSIGLKIIGLPHALFFGVLGALLTILPYIGILIGSILPALFALVAMDSLWYPVCVILVFCFVQFLEGNFISPCIVGNQVNINPYVAILGLFLGGMLLGAVGIVLAIPLLGITKIICDEFDSLKPVGYVLGRPKKYLNLWEWLIKKFQVKK